MTIRAHFDGKAIIPDDPVTLPVNQPLTIEVIESPASPSSPSKEEIERLFDEMEKIAITTDHPVDDSRESIYSGTIDDPR